MTTANRFTLSFKSNNHCTQTLTYNTSNKFFSYRSVDTDRAALFCTGHTTTFIRENKFIFATQAQQDEFDTALKNKDFDKALELAIIKENSAQNLNALEHPISYFLSGYLVEKEQRNAGYDGFCVKIGFFKKEKLGFKMEPIENANERATKAV